MDCPYKDCVHATQTPGDDETMTEGEIEAAVLAHDQVQAEADAAKKADEDAEAAASTEMDTGADASEKPAAQDLR